MDFNNYNNDFAKRILNDMFGSNESKTENRVNADEIAKPLFEMFNSFVKSGFTEDQAMDLVKFIIVSALKMNR